MPSSRCEACTLPETVCLCAEVRPVHTRTRVLLIQHWRDSWSATNTARLAALALPGLTRTLYGGPDRSFDERSLPTSDAWVLFPDGPTRDPLPPPPGVLVVVDGTWKQARRIVHHVPALRALPRLSLPAPEAGTRRLRQPPRGDGMSTLEAIASALALLEGEETAAPLRALHALHVARVLSCRGERP